MESVEPSDYVCIHCNLRFKNAKSFENHKRKFCQLQKRVIASSLPSARGYDESTNVHTKATLKSLSSDEFWHRKPETSRNGLLVDGKYKVYYKLFLVLVAHYVMESKRETYLAYNVHPTVMTNIN